jgi:hypothetical protein
LFNRGGGFGTSQPKDDKKDSIKVIGFGVFTHEGDQVLEFEGSLHQGSTTDDEVLFQKEFRVFRDESYASGKIYRFFFDQPYTCHKNQKYTLGIQAKQALTTWQGK